MSGRDMAQRDRGFVPVFLADWMDALFIHFRVEPRLLRAAVPLELDLFDGGAFISLVAFTQRRLRPNWGGRITELLATPLAQHAFLNFRTYVRHENEPAIFFMAEWISNRLAVLIGPKLYGLPYRLGKLRYHTSAGGGTRRVTAPGGEFICRARWEVGRAEISPNASEAEFLLERYAAFTLRRGVLRKFQIAHEPWRQTTADVTIERGDLLGLSLPPPCAAHYSPGVRDVGIGRPQRVAQGPAGWEFAPQRLTLASWK